MGALRPLMFGFQFLMSLAPSDCFLLHGSSDGPAERRLLRAGSLSMSFDAGDLRYIKRGEREVIRRIYAAVRDRNWGTVPAEISDLKTQIAEDHFRITYTSTHRQERIHFEWQAEIGFSKAALSGPAKNLLRSANTSKSKLDALTGKLKCAKK